MEFRERGGPGPDGSVGSSDVPKQSPLIRGLYTGARVLKSDYTPAGGVADLEADRADAISWGRDFISNPDLPARFRTGAEIAPNVNVPHSWYGQGPAGYIDYPMLTKQEQAAAE